MPGYDDKDTWRDISEALKAEQFGEEELLVLADAMSVWASRLEPFHKEFQLKLKARANQKRKCCIVIQFYAQLSINYPPPDKHISILYILHLFSFYL